MNTTCQRCGGRGASPLERSLHFALQTCTHNWIPAVDDPICDPCKAAYRKHLKEYDGTATTYEWRKRPKKLVTA